MKTRLVATILTAFLLAACGGSGSRSGGSGTPATGTPGAGSPRTGSAAGAGGTGCRQATKQDAGAALGKPTFEGTQEDEGKCFFAAADTRAATASEYVSIAVTKQASAEDARLSFEAGAGPKPNSIAGLGDAAAFKQDGNDSSIVVLKGSTTVLVEVRSDAQADPQGALKTLAAVVLSKA